MNSITFIIPTYNNLSLLKRCINSIEPQLENNDKIIIIDDGSSDGTFDYLQSEYSSNSKFILTQQENSGSGVARNKGISLNTNEYIWFVDSDDYIINNSLGVLREALKFDKPDIIYFDYYNDKITKETQVNLNINPNDKIGLLLSIHVPWNKIIKAKLFDNVRFPIGRIRYQDHGTIPIIICEAKKIRYIEEALYVYDFSHPNNIGKKKNKNNDIYVAFENLLYYFRKGMISKEELHLLYINTFVFSQIYNTSENSFKSIYENTKKVKNYLNTEYPEWGESYFFSKTFISKYNDSIEKLRLKIFIGKLLKSTTVIPTFAIYLFKQLKRD